MRVLPRTFYSLILAEALGAELAFNCSIRPESVSWKSATSISEVLSDPGLQYLRSKPNPQRMDTIMFLPQSFNTFEDFDSAVLEALRNEAVDWMNDFGLQATRSAVTQALEAHDP
jgi:hypothetical protein